jgi:hypothetical protein
LLDGGNKFGKTVTCWIDRFASTRVGGKVPAHASGAAFAPPPLAPTPLLRLRLLSSAVSPLLFRPACSAGVSTRICRAPLPLRLAMTRVVSFGPSPPPRRAPRKSLASRPPGGMNDNLCVELYGATFFLTPSRRKGSRERILWGFGAGANCENAVWEGSDRSHSWGR